MSDNPTHETRDARSFEERVFARFDSLDGRITSLEGRMTSLEEKVDARLRETRPIWEGVLTRLDSIEGELKVMNRSIRVLQEEYWRVRDGREELRERIEKLESAR